MKQDVGQVNHPLPKNQNCLKASHQNGPITSSSHVFTNSETTNLRKKNREIFHSLFLCKVEVTRIEKIMQTQLFINIRNFCDN